MQLFALSLDPLLTTLENTLTGINIGRRPAKTAVLAYADDVTLHVTSPHDIRRIKSAIEQYEAASGARINISKSRAMEVSSWDCSINVMDIPYHTEMKILGIYFTNTVRQSAPWHVTRTTGNYAWTDGYFMSITIC